MASNDDDSDEDDDSSYTGSEESTSSTDSDESSDDNSASSGGSNSNNGSKATSTNRSKSSKSLVSSHSSKSSTKSNSHHRNGDESILFRASPPGDTSIVTKETKKSAQASIPDRLDAAFKKNGSSNRVLLKLLQLNDDYTIFDPSDEGAEKYTLIDFREFDELKKGSACLLRRMGGNPSGKEVELERQRMEDLKSTIKVEAQSTIKGLMLEEARRVWSKNGKPEPKNFDEVRKMWTRDCSVESAEATWQVLYGLFDRLESSSQNRIRLSWDKRLEIMIMNSLSVAYLRSSVPSANPKGGPKPTGCVQKMVNQVKQETVKLIQRAGLQKHGHSLVLRMPDFAIKRGEREGHRQHGTMEYYMFYCKETESFPVLESKGGKCASPKASSDNEDGAILFQPKSGDLEESLRQKIQEQERIIAMLKHNEKSTNSKLQKSLGILSVHGSQRSADQLDVDVDVASKKVKDSRMKLKKDKSKKKKRKKTDADESDADKSKKKQKKTDADKSKKKKRKKMDADKSKKKKRKITKPPLVIKPKTWSKGAHPKRPSPLKGLKKVVDTTAKATDMATKATDMAANAMDMAANATDTAANAMDTAEKAKGSPRKGSPRKRKVPDPIELEEDESNDDIDCGECQGEVGSKVLGSKVVDGELMVYLEWDDNPKLVTLEPIDPVWKDFKSIFKDIEGPPRIRKWLDGRQTNKKSRIALAIAEVLPDGEDNDGDAVEAEMVEVLKAACSHEDITSLVREENSAYCGESCYLHGGHCSEEGCTREFVDKLTMDSKNEARPCNGKPAMVCPNFQRKACSFALCFDCYSKKLDTVGRTRRSRKT